MKKLYLLLILATTVSLLFSSCAQGDITSDSSISATESENSSEIHKTPLEMISELTEIEEGTELTELQEKGFLTNLSAIGINAEDYLYDGNSDTVMHADYCLTDNSSKPVIVRYGYKNVSCDAYIIIDKYGRLLYATNYEVYNAPPVLSENELIEIASDYATRYFGDEFEKYSLNNLYHWSDGNGVSFYWKIEGKERFSDIIGVELTCNGDLYSISASYSNLPDNYSCQELDRIAEEWFEENLKEIYPKTESYEINKGCACNINGKVYCDYIAAITLSFGATCCEQLVVQDMSINKVE